MRVALAAMIVLTAAAAGCTQTPESETMSLPGEVVTGDPVTTSTGLQYYVIAEGEGAQPTAGQEVTVHYTGYLTDGTKFDSSVDRGEPFNFALATGSVIAGWDEGVALMNIGGKYKLVIPPDLGYGEQGIGGTIPGGATLVFDVELLDAK